MAFDFPSSPTNGQLFQPAGGPSYVWNGSAWVIDYAWSALSTPGAVLIESKVISTAVATVDFTQGLDAAYDEFEIHLYNVKPSVETNLTMRVSFDAGATWRSDNSYHYNYRVEPVSGAAASVQGISSAYGWLGAPQGAAASNAPYAGIIRFWQPTDGVQQKNFMFDATGQNPSTYGSFRTSGVVKYAGATTAINGVRFLLSVAGTFTQGTFNLYGIKK